MPERCVIFDCRGDKLLGVLHEPAESAGELGVLIVVGGPQYRVGSHRQFVRMARVLAGAGFPVLRFDYRGMGDSEGTSRTFEAIDDDIRAAVDVMTGSAPGVRRIVLFGLCDAASAVLMYPVSDRRIVGMILANPWVRTESGQAKALVQHYYGHRLLQRAFWRKLVSGEVEVRASVRSLIATLSRALSGPLIPEQVQPDHFIDRMLKGAASGRPILLLMSGNDLTAREFDELCRSSEAWRTAVSAPRVRRLDLPDADHTFSENQSLELASKAAAGWLRGL